MKQKPKIPPTDWSKFENIPFAVVFWSSELGWLTMTQPDSPAEILHGQQAIEWFYDELTKDSATG